MNKVSIQLVVSMVVTFCIAQVVVASELPANASPENPQGTKHSVAQGKATAPLPAPKKATYGDITGEWQRTDGNYTFKITDVKTGGKAKVEYLNPKPIFISKSEVSMWKGLVKLEVEFQDKGYEGSKYRLFYYAEKDAIAGYYYQASGDKTYRVIFLRKKK